MKQGLNDQQISAIVSSFNKVLVLAGAGTGKTTTLTERIRHLVVDKMVSGSSIMAVTFTNKAAREIFERLKNIVPGEELEKISIGTFHSIALNMLREAGYKLGYGSKITVYDSDDQLDLIMKINDRLGLKLKETTLRKILSNPDEMDDKHKIIYREYEYQLKQNNAVDFKKIISEAVELLSQHEDIQEIYHHKFKHVLIDEYQDTNMLQYRFIKLIDPDNIYAVGDNDQAIYAWRGANIQIILNFKTEYACAKVVILDKNYRSGKIVIERANSLIKHNMGRFEKELIPTRDITGECRVRELDDELKEAIAIKNEIADIVAEGYDYGDIAILARTNRICDFLAQSLSGKVPSVLINKNGDIWKRSPAINLLNMLWLLINPFDDFRAERFLLKDLKIDGGEFKHIKEIKNKNKTCLLNAYKQYFNIQDGTFPFVEVTKISEAIKIIYDHFKYDRLKDLYFETWEKYQIIRKEIEHFAYHFIDKVDVFLSHMALRSDQDMVDNALSEDKVKIMTIHGAKGLEFPVVFLAGIEDGICPSKRGDIEEERRVFYVAITRAKDRLIITRPLIREGFNQMYATTISQFVKEMQGGK